MNEGIQKQLGLNFEVVLKAEDNVPNRSFDITNNSKTTIYWYGSQDQNGKKNTFKPPNEIQPGEVFRFDVGPFFGRPREPYMGDEVSLVSALFFKNHVGEEYVGRYIFMGHRKDGFFSAGPLFVTREDWSSKSFNLLKAR